MVNIILILATIHDFKYNIMILSLNTLIQNYTIQRLLYSSTTTKVRVEMDFSVIQVHNKQSI